MILTIAPNWRMHSTAGELTLVSERTRLTLSLGEDAARVAALLDEGWPDDPAFAPSLRADLLARGVLSEPLSVADPSLSRQAEYWRAVAADPKEAVGRLSDARVSVLGLGGVGGAVLQHLAAAGIRSFHLVDDDVVDVSNFNRQFIYTRDQIGVPKVDAASKYLRDRWNARVSTSSSSVESEREVHDAGVLDGDLVVVAIDRPSISTARTVTEVAWAAGVPSILISIGLDRSLVSPIFDRRRGARAPNLTLQLGRSSVERPFLASHGPTNTVPSAFASDWVIHHLAGITERAEYRRALIVERGTDGLTRTHLREVVRT